MLKKVSLFCILSLSLLFAACEDDDNYSSISVSNNNGKYSCKGNGTQCIARNYLLTCKNDVTEISESDKCADTPGEYNPSQGSSENSSVSFNCQMNERWQTECTCKGTGTKCDQFTTAPVFLRCNAGSFSMKTCRNSCDKEAGCDAN